MEEIFNAVLTTSFHASIVGLVIIFVKWILKDKINPGWHYLIWAVLILKLLIPFTPPSPASIFNAVPAVTQNVDFARLPVKDNHELPATNTKGKFLSNAAADKESIKRDDFLEKAKKTAAYIWISVFVFSIVFAIYTNFAFRGRLKKRNKTAPEWIYKILEKEKQRLGVKGEIEIIVQDIINTPSLFGIYKPKLLISPAMLNLRKENISYIILHELAHLKRRDIMANYLLLFLQMMHWFNPLIWWFFKIIRQDMEMAADEMVLVLLEGPERKEYGKTLISVLESFNSQKPSLKLVGMVDDAGNIERRLKMIKMADLFKYKRRLFVITGVICFAILSFVLLTNPIAKNSLQIGSYIVEVPDNFRVKTDTPGLITQKNTIFGFITGTKIISFKELVFEENNVTVGGIQIIRYEPDQRLFLPNHSQVKSQEEIKGLITKAVMVNLDLTQPAASKDTSVKNENHLYLIFEKDGIAYDIYADSKYVDKTQLIKIAKSFRPSDNSGAIRSVEQFGRNLKKVDKLSPEKVCREQIKENYSAYVAPSLLSEWLEDPSKAPGRYTSSPWPDRIEIKDIVKIHKNKYMLYGDIVEITSVPDEEWRTGITLTVERFGKDWFITGFKINERLQHHYDSLAVVSEKNRKIQLYIRYAEAIHEWIKETYEYRQQELRKQLEERVNRIFAQMYHGRRKVSINERFRVTLWTSVDKDEMVTDESRGLETVKNFAFIAGLVDLAREKIKERTGGLEMALSSEPYPLVMDAPFSNADEKHVSNISRVLPDIAEQVIMVVMAKDWGFAEPVMGYRVGKKYYLDKRSETLTYIRESV